MSAPTPRTDAATYPADCLGKTLVTNRDCARALERELTALTCGELSCDECNARTAALTAELTIALAKWNGALERAMKAEADLAALAQCHDDNCRAVVKIAAELATERAWNGWVFLNCKVESDDYTTGNREVYAIHDREDLGAALKEDAK